jgi:hypothetical protein
MSSFLAQKVPLVKVPEIRENKTGKVLSSAQNLKKMEEKEEAK